MYPILQLRLRHQAYLCYLRCCSSLQGCRLITCRRIWGLLVGRFVRLIGLIAVVEGLARVLCLLLLCSACSLWMIRRCGRDVQLIWSRSSLLGRLRRTGSRELAPGLPPSACRNRFIVGLLICLYVSQAVFWRLLYFMLQVIVSLYLHLSQ